MNTPEPVTGYCMKCRAQQPIQNPAPRRLKNHANAVAGQCPDCGGKVFRMVKDPYNQLPLPQEATA